MWSLLEPHKWTVLSFLVVLANILIVGAIKGYIGLLIVKLIVKIMVYFKVLNLGLLMTKAHALLVGLGIPDAYLGAFDLVCPS